MGLALASSAGLVTNPSTTVTTWTAATGDSNTVKSFTAGTDGFIVSMWGSGATAGILQVTSPRLHDTTRGIYYNLKAADSRPPWQMGLVQRIYPQDVLVPGQSGGGSEVDSGCMLQWFADLPGVNARLIDGSQLNRNSVEDLVTVSTSHTAGTAGDWSGSVALNSVTSLLKANRDYVLLGFVTNTAGVSVGLRGPDSGNLRVCGPMNIDNVVTNTWYSQLSRWTGLPCNVVINAANQGATFVDLQSNAGSGTVLIQHTFALLK